MKPDQKGMTFIELMIVIVIIGVLASIAIGITMQVREKAYQKTLESDLSMAYKAALACHMEDPGKVVDETDLEANGYRKSDGVTINIINGTMAELKITVTHPGVIGIYQVDNAGTISKQ